MSNLHILTQKQHKANNKITGQIKRKATKHHWEQLFLLNEVLKK